jgi:hypothetical protein
MKSSSNQRRIAHEKDEVLLSRKQVANRWSVSLETVKRRQAAGLLNPLYFSARQVRYRLSDVVSVEESAAEDTKNFGLYDCQGN